MSMIKYFAIKISQVLTPEKRYYAFLLKFSALLLSPLDSQLSSTPFFHLFRS